METWSPRWSVSGLINETVPGRLQRDGPGDGGRRDDRRARRLRRARGRRGRARAGPRSARRSAANAAVWAAEVGARARVHGRIGSDVAGALLRDELIAREGRASAGDRPGTPTPGTMLVVHEPRERSMVADRGAGGRLSRGPSRTARRGRRPRLRLLAPVRADLGGRGGGPRARPRAFRRRRRGVVAHDPLVRRGAVPPGRANAHDAPGANLREAEELTGLRGDAAFDELARAFPVVCLKLGDEGALMSWEGLVIRNTTDAVREKDPTGAGDAFNGVLLASLVAGRSPGDAIAGPPGRCEVAVSFETWPERPRERRRPRYHRGDGAVERRSSCERGLGGARRGRGRRRPRDERGSQGPPPPRNLECVERMTTAIRSAGAVPGGSGCWGARRWPACRRTSWPRTPSRVGRPRWPDATPRDRLGRSRGHDRVEHDLGAHRVGIGVGAPAASAASTRGRGGGRFRGPDRAGPNADPPRARGRNPSSTRSPRLIASRSWAWG